MKRTVTVFGLISGLLLSIFICLGIPFMQDMTAETMDTNVFVGYALQLLAFSLIFFAIRQYRDKHLGGSISFGKAFLTGLWISLIGSAFYVITWAIVYHNFLPDFMDIWGKAQIEAATKKGASASEIASIRQQVAEGKELYSTWWGFTGFTLVEILPTGLIVTLVCALILKRRRREAGGSRGQN